MSSSARKRAQGSPWQARYGRRHGYYRVTDEAGLPNGRRGRVTIYRRGDNGQAGTQQVFILSWCAQGQHRKEKVTGDKFDAVRRADEINAALESGNGSGSVTGLDIDTLISRYTGHLEQRAAAGEVRPSTPGRYRTALQHLAEFVHRQFSDSQLQPWRPTREMVLGFKTHLSSVMISPNGHPHAHRRPLSTKGSTFILCCCRAMVRWAVQEDLLPAQCAEAFVHSGRSNAAGIGFSDSPIKTDQVVRLIRSADLYQLAVFAFHIFLGVRVTEPCWAMIENVDLEQGWVEFRCNEQLAYRTKGNTDKRLPLCPALADVITLLADGRTGGPLVLKRRLFEKRGKALKPVRNLNEIIRKVQSEKPSGWAERSRIASGYMKKAGGVVGDDLRREFRRLTAKAEIPQTVTPKALRHHFASALEQAGVPYYTRKYLLGHRVDQDNGRASDITAIYTHLEPDFIRQTYQGVLTGPMAGVAEAFVQRLQETSSDRAGARS